MAKLRGNVRKVLNRRSGAILAASAMAVAAWEEYSHRRVLRADIDDSDVRVERLSDLRYDAEGLATIEAGLVREWGPFGLLGFESAAEMARVAGGTIFVAEVREGERFVPKGIVQTILVEAGGDPERLLADYPTFGELTSRDSWRKSGHGGDTVVLLQITVFEARGGGLGSLLRNAVLNMIGKDVRHALTTTPVDPVRAKRQTGKRAKVSIDDPKTYTAAMRFHAHAGATPSVIAEGYKASEVRSGHGEDVVFMRYERGEEDAWPEPPEMHVTKRGPVGERLTRTVRRLRWSRRKVTLPAVDEETGLVA
jgi:hypothetical protein